MSAEAEIQLDPSTLHTLDATTLARSVRDGSATASDVVEAHLDRITSLNGELNAITVLFSDDARRAAGDVDSARARGDLLGALAGVPVTIKEIYDVAGSATTLGVAAFAGAISPADGPVVASLRNAGAIIIGRTNMPDFATRWHTDNDLRGPTVNPWDARRSPGGSSGGDAVAVAVGMTALGLGGDYGGSLRIPANNNGVAALRPTPGRIANAGFGPPPSMTIQLFASDGPIARSVSDLDLAYRVMAGTATHHGDVAERGRGCRVAVSTDPSGEGVDPQVGATVRKAADALSDAGYEVEEVDIPDVAAARDLFRDLVATEISLLTLGTVQALGSAGINTYLRDYFEIATVFDAHGYADALARRFSMVETWTAFLRRYPIVLGPVSTELPFPVGFDLGGPSNVLDQFRAHRLTVAANVVALPAVAVPVSLSRERLPIGVQLITTRFDELTALAAAAEIEDRVGAPRLSAA